MDGKSYLKIKQIFSKHISELHWIRERRNTQLRLKVSKCNVPVSVSLQDQCRTVMQAQEVLRQLRIPELEDLRQYIRGLPANALMGMGAVAAITTYWFASRPKALTPPCDLGMQSLEMPVGDLFSFLNYRNIECPECLSIHCLVMLCVRGVSKA